MSGIPLRLPGTTINRELKRFWRPHYRKKLKKERVIREKMYNIMKEAMMLKIDPLPYKKTPLLPPVSRKVYHVDIKKLEITDEDRANPTPEQIPLVRERVRTLCKLGFSRSIIEARMHTEFITKLDKREAALKATLVRQEIENGIKLYEQDILRLSASTPPIEALPQSTEKPK